MGYRWKPNAAQRKAYAAKMREQEESNWDFINSKGAIRVGCYVKWVDNATNELWEGHVTKSTYRSDNQHSFTIDGKVVMGRNLYSKLLVHNQGDLSKQQSVY